MSSVPVLSRHSEKSIIYMCRGKNERGMRNREMKEMDLEIGVRKTAHKRGKDGPANGKATFGLPLRQTEKITQAKHCGACAAAEKRCLYIQERGGVDAAATAD